MPILFALIVISHAGYGNAMVTRAGLYESKWNCEHQRAFLLPLLERAGSPDDYVICLPTNG